MVFDASYVLREQELLASPALLVYPDVILENIRRAIAIAGDVDRLRPHVKTHKSTEIAKMQMAEGITRFKCATLAEAEMLASAGARDILIAYPMVGPNVDRLLTLTQNYPGASIKVLADSAGPTITLAKAFHSAGATVEVMLDLDTGMHRTGIPPGDDAEALYSLIEQTPGITPGGLHCYDGHCHQRDLSERCAASSESRQMTRELAGRLRAQGKEVPRIVLGGTPSFPCHAADGVDELSPGTFVLYDGNYLYDFKDLPFRPAALLLTRVISRPAADRITLDLGHKAVSADPTGPRGFVVATASLGGVDSSEFHAVSQSEEHWVIQTAHAGRLSPGEAVYVLPAHICPTVALHENMYVVNDGQVVETWSVSARRR